VNLREQRTGIGTTVLWWQRPAGLLGDFHNPCSFEPSAAHIDVQYERPTELLFAISAHKRFTSS